MMSLCLRMKKKLLMIHLSNLFYLKFEAKHLAHTVSFEQFRLQVPKDLSSLIHNDSVGAIQFDNLRWQTTFTATKLFGQLTRVQQQVNARIDHIQSTMGAQMQEIMNFMQRGVFQKRERTEEVGRAEAQTRRRRRRRKNENTRGCGSGGGSSQDRR